MINMGLKRGLMADLGLLDNDAQLTQEEEVQLGRFEHEDELKRAPKFSIPPHMQFWERSKIIAFFQEMLDYFVDRLEREKRGYTLNVVSVVLLVVKVKESVSILASVKRNQRQIFYSSFINSLRFSLEALHAFASLIQMLKATVSLLNDALRELRAQRNLSRSLLEEIKEYLREEVAYTPLAPISYHAFEKTGEKGAYKLVLKNLYDKDTFDILTYMLYDIQLQQYRFGGRLILLSMPSELEFLAQFYKNHSNLKNANEAWGVPKTKIADMYVDLMDYYPMYGSIVLRCMAMVQTLETCGSSSSMLFISLMEVFRRFVNIKCMVYRAFSLLEIFFQNPKEIPLEKLFSSPLYFRAFVKATEVYSKEKEILVSGYHLIQSVLEELILKKDELESSVNIVACVKEVNGKMLMKNIERHTEPAVLNSSIQLLHTLFKIDPEGCAPLLETGIPLLISTLKKLNAASPVFVPLIMCLNEIQVASLTLRARAFPLPTEVLQRGFLEGTERVVVAMRQGGALLVPCCEFLSRAFELLPDHSSVLESTLIQNGALKEILAPLSTPSCDPLLINALVPLFCSLLRHAPEIAKKFEEENGVQLIRGVLPSISEENKSLFEGPLASLLAQSEEKMG